MSSQEQQQNSATTSQKTDSGRSDGQQLSALEILRLLFSQEAVDSPEEDNVDEEISEEEEEEEEEKEQDEEEKEEEGGDEQQDSEPKEGGEAEDDDRDCEDYEDYSTDKEDEDEEDGHDSNVMPRRHPTTAAARDKEAAAAAATVLFHSSKDGQIQWCTVPYDSRQPYFSPATTSSPSTPRSSSTSSSPYDADDREDRRRRPRSPSPVGTPGPTRYAIRAMEGVRQEKPQQQEKDKDNLHSAAEAARADSEYEAEAEDSDGGDEGDRDCGLGRGGPVPSAALPSHDPQQRQQQHKIASTFGLFVTPEIEQIIVAETNREGVRRFGSDVWKSMDEVDLRAYLGLLILAGVFKSRGEAAASLWDAHTGRAVFRATMSLKTFYRYSRHLRFDDRATRGARRSADKLAAIRRVWDLWAAQLPRLYNPGRNVTVDEQLVRFRGRCPFRQYMPNKPAKYGIKTWVACDARSSYAWKMQIYTGGKNRPADCGTTTNTTTTTTTTTSRNTNLATQVVLDLTEGLGGERTVTCDNFFTSYELARRLYLERDLTLVGTVRKNKPWLPQAFLRARLRQLGGKKRRNGNSNSRPSSSSSSPLSAYLFAPLPAVLVSYMPKKKRNVLLLSTKRRHLCEPVERGERERERQDAPIAAGAARGTKPDLVNEYNRNKGGVDNLDKVISAYSCRRMTARWPLAVFHNILDVSSYNAFVLWRELNPTWMSARRNKRRIFLEQLGKELVTPLIQRRRRMPRTETSLAVVLGIQRQGQGQEEEEQEEEQEEEEEQQQDNRPKTSNKRKRCQICPSKKDRKTQTVCSECNKYMCGQCSVQFCQPCSNAFRGEQD
ncbi:piggyBac transposable element-derived protein 4-like [Boleophthalmus pectinirostris]|uniref:piggyBac transposable element-derived protein 4-like n=1 Tax=Boleophthalmus pectinirostris TaxID=150288 RepID=UPI00242D465B|nr:piggyBac transposable element-derived protein 4-like [Boleophthalmus pectinirostris]